MSSRSYRVSFVDAEEERRIREEIERLMKQEHERIQKRRKILSKLEWAQESTEKLNLSNRFAEVKVPHEWTREEGILNESLFVGKTKEGIDIAIFDQNLPEGKCEEIVSKFSREIYKKATGREASEDSVSVQPIVRLKHPVCQHCFNPIKNFTYKCPVCGRGFCYSHRRPESHGCSQKQMKEKSELTKKQKFIKKEKEPESKSKNPKIIIKKVPCG